MARADLLGGGELLLVFRVIVGNLGVGHGQGPSQPHVVNEQVAELPLRGVGEVRLVGVVVRLGIRLGRRDAGERTVDRDVEDVERGRLVPAAVLAFDIRLRDHDPGR